MKENAIKKINTMGKVGTIVALVAKIFVIVLLSLSVIGFVGVLVLPSNLCTVKIDGRAKVGIDLSHFGVEMNDEVNKEITENVNENVDITYAGNHFSVDNVQTNDKGFNFDAGATLSEFNIKDVAWVLAGAIIYLILLLISTIYAGRLAKSFRSCQSPFEETVIKRMKQFAYSLIPWAVSSSVIGAIQQRIWIASSKNIALSLDISMVIVVLVILALAYIFQYGAVLQKESDETL